MKRRTVIAAGVAGLVGTALTALPAAARPGGRAAGRRVVVYYQTQYTDGTYVSPLGLTENAIGATHLIVGAVHLNDVNGQHAPVHLNDDPPGAAKYAPMWSDLKALRGAGVPVLAMVGGAAPGSFTRLDTEFDTYYPLLRDFLRQYALDGVDLDVEEDMSLAGVERVIDALRADFGAGFLITLAPVGTALSGGGNLSGFDYEQLYRDRGEAISWFNAQLYNGWGSMASTADVDAVLERGLIPQDKLVAGVLTDPANGGSGYVDMPALTATIRQLTRTYPDFGGVDGWEYFNSQPGGTPAPWKWAAEVSAALNG
ncbi:glycosyl hydrolase family 18 protein [Streptomyces iconiensis]|uniref:Glycosyl hydrolase family 18 protein n=1 Tax=Streptomyces iconiensis TaxID=1384038 RepID=A0ABT7A6W6_9ACTN|nr:glycosyl hydrolase family 18 protein [Streptomyces iconiensis]MDJ1137088.1 glycosyl hydrolase family 18 protein [Streptomyces iconiensis]